MNEVSVTSILKKYKQRDSWFLTNDSVNPYQGCLLNCLYYYIRGGKHGVEINVSVKKNAVVILNKQVSLRAKRNNTASLCSHPQPIHICPLERKRTETSIS